MEINSGQAVFDVRNPNLVMLKGQITEETDFAPLLEKLGSPVEINLSQVHRINSCGVREWVGFVRSLTTKGKKFSLSNCAPVIVSQLNTIANFAAGGQVTSVLGPYYCSSCDSEHEILIDLSPSAEAWDWEKPIACPKCGNAEMEFDDMEEMYLEFHNQSQETTTT